MKKIGIVLVLLCISNSIISTSYGFTHSTALYSKLTSASRLRTAIHWVQAHPTLSVGGAVATAGLVGIAAWLLKKRWSRRTLPIVPVPVVTIIPPHLGDRRGVANRNVIHPQSLGIIEETEDPEISHAQVIDRSAPHRPAPRIAKPLQAPLFQVRATNLLQPQLYRSEQQRTAVPTLLRTQLMGGPQRAAPTRSHAQQILFEQHQKENQQKQQTRVPQQNIDSWLGLEGLSGQSRIARLEQLIKWYEAGRRFLQMIHENPDVAHIPTDGDLRNLTWFFYLNAGLHECNNFFREGTFRIIDTTKRNGTTIKALFEAFETFAKSRYSSHLTEFPHDDFGIDVDQLPANKTHLLFSHISDEWLFLKPENYGVSGIVSGLFHLYEWGREFVRSTPLAKPLGMASNLSEDQRKERTEILKTAAPLLQQVTSVLGRNEQPGQQTISSYIKFFSQILPEVIDKNETLAKEISAFIARIIKKYPDTWQERIGNEVILNVNDLLHAPDIVIDNGFLKIRI